jgi:hypothetical protein
MLQNVARYRGFCLCPFMLVIGYEIPRYLFGEGDGPNRLVNRHDRTTLITL